MSEFNKIVESVLTEGSDKQEIFDIIEDYGGFSGWLGGYLQNAGKTPEFKKFMKANDLEEYMDDDDFAEAVNNKSDKELKAMLKSMDSMF